MDEIVIGIFGLTNAGKSTLFNRLAGQQIAIVSSTAGTTTDPVRKKIELPEIGKCTLIDTAGLDDVGELASERIAKTLKVADEVDVAIYVENNKMHSCNLGFVGRLMTRLDGYSVPVVKTSSDVDLTALFIDLASAVKSLDAADSRTILDGLVSEGDNVALVCPIDAGAPKGRLILPQIMAIRDILDHGGTCAVLQPNQLNNYLENTRNTTLVVTDSQAFDKVASIVPETLPLTSFSMLLARNKGPFSDYLKGVTALDSLRDGDSVLILESCSHHATCEDIGRVKLPAMVRKYSGAALKFDFVNGLDDIPDITAYKLVIQCGGCMVTSRQLKRRVGRAVSDGIPVTNYGMAIAYMNDIFDRVIKPLL